MARFGYEIAAPMSQSFNYSRRLFNANRTKDTDPYFIDEWIKPGGFLEKLARSH